MIAGIITVCVLLLILPLLLAPILIRINSKKDLYLIRWIGFAGAKVSLQKESLSLWILFWKKDYDLTELLMKRSKKKMVRKKKKKKRKFKLSKVRSLLNSFEVRKFNLNFDSDDFVLNAYLFPILHFLSRKQVQISTNFNGNFELEAEVVNRPIWLMRALFS